MGVGLCITGICGRQIGNGTGFRPRTYFGFPLSPSSYQRSMLIHSSTTGNT